MKVTTKSIQPKVQALAKAVNDLLGDIMSIEQMNHIDAYILANLRYMKAGADLLEGFVNDTASRKAPKESKQEDN